MTSGSGSRCAHHSSGPVRIYKAVPDESDESGGSRGVDGGSGSGGDGGIGSGTSTKM